MAWKLKDLFSRNAGGIEASAQRTAAPGADECFQQGNAQVSQQQWQAALDCYQRAVELEPRHAAAHAYAGNVLRQLGRLDEALAAYQRAIAIQPDFAEVHYNRASLLHQTRQLPASLDSYDAALAANPAFAEAHCNRGDVLRGLGRRDEALASYASAIKVNGAYAKAYMHLGLLQQELRQPQPAEANYRQAIASRPDYVDAHFNLGVLQADTDQNGAALSSFDAAISLAPGHAGAHSGRGLVLMKMGDPAAAVASFDTAIRLRPEHAPVYVNRAIAQERLGLVAEALASHDHALALSPEDVSVQFNRGDFFAARKQWLQAIQCYEAALVLQPDLAIGYCGLGIAQHRLERLDVALENYCRAIDINPELASAYINRGNLFRLQRRFDDAFADYRRAIALDANSAEAHYNLAQLALLLGDYATGWPEFEWRGLIEEALAVVPRKFQQPAWFGEQSLEGKQILLHAEQGLGETLQFCRYVSLVAARGARVVLEVQPALGELLAGLDGVSQLIVLGSPIPPTDYHCSLTSLPGAFKTTPQTIPSEVPYVRVDAQRVVRCREMLGRRTQPRVGLAWSGNPRYSNDKNRSIALAQVIAHLPENCEYFCLQGFVSDADQQLLRAGERITRAQSLLSNFPDTAALVENLDVVISVDTSLAHLSGAMGKPTWVLLPSVTDWRWMLDRRDSPWYPSATLYRQPVAGDWDSVLTEVRKDLLDLSRKPLPSFD